MRRGRDGIAVESAQVFDVEDLPGTPRRIDQELLVEIAIVDTSVWLDADELATHEFRHGLCVKVRD